MKKLLAMCLLVGLFNSAQVNCVTINDLLQTPVVSNVKVSPGGDHLAVRMLQEGKHVLVFFDRATKKPVGGARFAANEEVGNFQWVNDERVVINVWAVSDKDPAPRNFGELYAVNYDGSKGEMIFGYRAGRMQTGSMIKQKDNEYAWGEVIDPLKGDDNHILVSSTKMSSSRDARAVAEKLHVYSGVDKGKTKIAKYSQADFFTDGDGDVRFVRSEKDYHTSHFEMLPDKNKDWIEVDSSSVGHNFSPQAISADGSSLFALDDLDGDTKGLYQLALDGSGYKKLYRDENLDVTSLIRTSDGNGVFAMKIDDGYPKYLLFSKAYEEAEVFKRLLASFPGQLVSITSRSDDGEYWVVYIGSDRNPGAFYLFEKSAPRLSKIYDAIPDIEVDALAPTAPIQYASFDEQLIHGYFTQPLTVTADTPMVVLIHGGPRARDVWGFDGEVQSLALHGYSVLQINYRGSTGYGAHFRHAGDGHWGDDVQQDILAGVKWAIKNSKVKAGNVCLMGASFGAYSAVQSALLSPDSFKCVIANAGVYDLNLMYREGDVGKLFYGEDYLDEVLGKDAQVRAAMSPVNHIDKLEAPILVAHGKRDERAPVVHAERLIKALKKNKKDYETFIKREERHGFYDDENRIAYMEAVLKFLNKNLQ